MKKIIALITILIVLISQSFFTKENSVYEISIKNSESGLNKMILEVKTDFIENIKMTKENNKSVYYDIENAVISDNLKTNQDKFNSNISILAQQIGQKTRIYLKGDNIGVYEPVIVPNKNIKPINYNPLYPIGAFMIFISLVAIYACSATMKLSKTKSVVKSPLHDAVNLNRSLYYRPIGDGARHGRYRTQNSSNPVKQGVYIDFVERKDKINSKIAI